MRPTPFIGGAARARYIGVSAPARPAGSLAHQSKPNCQIKSRLLQLIALTRWVRLRLRAALWRQWKTPRRRRAALIANGVPEWAARNTAGSGRGPWYLARSRALSTGLSNASFKSLGLPSLFQSC